MPFLVQRIVMIIVSFVQDNEMNFFINNISEAATFSPLLPLFFLILIRSNKEYWPIKSLVVISCVISLYSGYQAKFLNTNNMPSLHLLTVLEFLCISFFYNSSFRHFYLKKISLIAGVGFTLFSIGNSLFFQDIYTYNSYARGLEAFLVICLSLLYFYETLQRQEIVRLEHSPTFWFNTAFLLYFTSTQFLFLFNNLILTTYSKDISNLFWKVHAFVCILYYLLLAVGIWKVRFKPTSPISLS